MMWRVVFPSALTRVAFNMLYDDLMCVDSPWLAALSWLPLFALCSIADHCSLFPPNPSDNLEIWRKYLVDHRDMSHHSRMP